MRSFISEGRIRHSNGDEDTANFHMDVVTSAFSQDVKHLAEDPSDFCRTGTLEWKSNN